MAVLSKSKQLKKDLSLFNIYTIATGATIASGFFLLPGLAFSQAGPAMVLSYLIAAIPVIPALYSKAELCTAMPRAGGVYFFLDRSMGPWMGTIGGLGTWLVLMFKTAFGLIGIGAYLRLFLPQLEMLPLAIGFALIFGIINLFGAKKSGSLQSILVVGLLLILSYFSVSGISEIDYQNFDGFLDEGFHSVFATAGLVYVSYVGLSKVASISEEVKNPIKNIPKAMFLAFGTALLIYVVGTVIMIGTVPAQSLQNSLTPVATAAKIFMGPSGVFIMSVAAIFAFFSVANAGILSASRYPLALSRDHLLPRFFGVFTKHKTPSNSIFVTVAFIIIILVLFNPVKIAKLAGSFQLLLFSLNSLAVIVMRESRIDSYDPGFRSPLYPWMQIFGVVSPIWLIIEMGWMSSLFTVALFGLGTFWYFYYGRKRVVRNGAIYHIFARLGQQRTGGVESELRSILNKKGLRDEDPFDVLVARAKFLDIKTRLSFEELVERVSGFLSNKLDVGPKELKQAFIRGTMVGATPMARNAALPHIRLAEIQHSELVIVRCKNPVFINIDNGFMGTNSGPEAIHAFFFLASPDRDPAQHLRILAQIARHIDDEKFIGNWLTAQSEPEIKELLLREDRYISLQLKAGSKTGPLIGLKIKEINLPEETLVAIIHRDGQIIVPKGHTVLEEQDRLTIISNSRAIRGLYDKFSAEII
jgi:basic amino acid/polyamine antiporter, APA family